MTSHAPMRAAVRTLAPWRRVVADRRRDRCMQDDPPTMPSLRPFRDDAGERDFGGSPTWPLAGGDAGTWTHPRRVDFKAESLEQGPNVRFVVTTRSDAPLALYNWYVQRGTSEQWIDDLKGACFADRLSCHCFWANQLRLLLAACRRLLAPRHAAALAALAGRRPPAARHAAPVPPQDRRLGPPLRRRLPSASGEQSPRRTPLAPPRRSLSLPVNNPG